jgi:hypothetical protein
VRAAAILLCSVLFLAACGDEEEVDPEADRQRAETALLTVDELPPGFEESSDDDPEDDESDAADRCLESSDADVTSEEVDEARTAQVSREFDADEGINVEAEVSVFREDDIPETLVGVLEDEEALDCLTEAIQQDAAQGGEGVTIGSVEVTEAPALPDDLGDQRTSARLELVIEAPTGDTLDFTSDLYIVRVDRAVATLTVTQLAGQQLEEADVNTALEAMVTRLEEDD